MSNINTIGRDLTVDKKSEGHNSKDYSTIWNTKKLEYYKKSIEDGIKVNIPSPFHDGNVNLRKARVSFVHTPEEIEEIRKCKNDVVYFAEKYCHSMTDNGISNVKLRAYQKKILRGLQNNRFNCWLSSRQAGKTVTSSFFMMWFLCFNVHKNIFVVANKGETMVEVLDKVRTVYEYLPYFLKPGIITNNVKSMVFDNRCRIIGQATTSKPGLGFTIHLLYCDEFAHIPASILDPFWENVFPTLSSSQISRVIVTSTANGINKFSNIYLDAVKGKNEFNPIRVDWWEIPGRDENWKMKEISNLGSEAAFNQQYGNQFISSSGMLFDFTMLKLWDRFKRKFIWKDIEILNNYDINYSGLTWDEKFDIENIKNSDQYILSIDPADGIGKDFTVCTIFKLEPLSNVKIRKIRKYESELDFFKLRQVGIFRSNELSLDKFGDLLKVLCFEFFSPENTCVILEMNDNRSSLLLNKLENTKNYEDDMIFHTFHSQTAKYTSPGIKLNKQNKALYTNQLRGLVKDGKIFLKDEITINECSSFGINNKGHYISQLGNDDIVMSIVNLVPFFRSSAFADRVEEIYDDIEISTKKEINKITEHVDAEKSVDDIDYSILEGLM